MSRFHFVGKLVCFAAVLGLFLSPSFLWADPAAPVTMAEAWGDATKLLNVEAGDAFKARAKDHPREANYGMAMAWLQAQPKTEANILTAVDLLKGVIKGDENDDLGLASQYYLARIEESHHADVGYGSIDERFQKAEKLYRDLFEKHPGTLWSELAIIRYGELRFYQNEPLAKKGERVAEIEGLLPQIHTPWVLGLYHLNLSNAYARLDISEPKALDHLILAEQLGIPQRQTRADALVRIIRWAQLQGKPDIVSHYAQIFLKDFPRDDRSYQVGLLLHPEDSIKS